MQLQDVKLSNIINKEQTVVSVAEELSVSRQTVHKWLIRYKRFGISGVIRTRQRKRSGPAHNKTSEAVELCVEYLAQKYIMDGAETCREPGTN